MEPLDHRMSRILRLTQFLDQNLGNPVSVNALAAQACYSPYHFERVFGDAVGTTPMDYVRQRRLQRAALRVRYEKKTGLFQLAQECGFASNASFSRSFRQHFGFTPSDWRHGAWYDYMLQNLQRWHDLVASDPSPELQRMLKARNGLPDLRWNVASRVVVQNLPPATLWYRRYFGMWGPELDQQVDLLLDACLQNGIASEGSCWCSAAAEDQGLVMPEDLVCDFGLLAEGPPPPGLLSREVPGGLYAVLETCNEAVTTQWLHEDWLDQQSRWTADMSRSYIYLWRDSPEGVHKKTLLPVRLA